MLLGWGDLQSAEDPTHGLWHDRSTCTVQIAVKDDRFVVKDVDFKPSNRFLKTFPRPSDVEVRALIKADVNRLLDLDLPLSVWASSDADIVAYVRSPKRPKSTLLTGDHSWEEAASALKAAGSAQNLDQILTQIVDSLAYFDKVLIEDIALRRYDNPAKGEELIKMREAGQLIFRVSDPVTPADVQSTSIRFADSGARNTHKDSRFGVSNEDLSRLLQPLIGRLWNQREIAVRLVDFYAPRGMGVVEPIHPQRKVDAVNAKLLDRDAEAKNLAPQAVLGELWSKKFDTPEYGLVSIQVRDYSSETARRILISETRHVKQLSIGITDKQNDDEVRRLLYTVLDQSDWRSIRKNELNGFLQNPRSPSPDGTTVRWMTVPRTFAKWPMAEVDLRRRAAALIPHGYNAAVTEVSPKASAVFLSPLPRAKVEEKLNETCPETVTGAPEPDDPEEQETTPDPNKPRPTGPKESELTPRVVEKEYRNYARAGATYHPGQGTELSASYQKVLLKDRTARAEIELGNFQESTGKIRLEKGYVAFAHLGRKLDLDLSAYSEFEPDRVTDTGTVDERRKGAHASGHLQVMRSHRGHWLTVTAAFEHDRVETNQSSSEDRSSAEVSFIWFWRNPADIDTAEVTVEGSAAARRRGGNDFARTSLSGRMHQPLPGYFEFNLAAAVSHSGDRAPPLEQPHLEDELAVRGYRAGVAYGTLAVATQIELWMPLRALDSRFPSFGHLLRRQYCAVFVDYGGFREKKKKFQSLAGIGVGLRLKPRPGAVIALDLAHGVTDYEGIQGRTRFHLNVAADFPF